MHSAKDDKSKLTLSMLIGSGKEKMEVFYISKGWFAKRYALELNRRHIMCLIKKTAEKLGATIIASPAYLSNLPEPLEGDRYILELRNGDGEIVVTATYQEVSIEPMSIIDRDVTIKQLMQMTYILRMDSYLIIG
jgi:hypothetical protein